MNQLERTIVSSAPVSRTGLVGEPAIRYVTRWRMQVAQSALETDSVTVAELATASATNPRRRSHAPSNASPVHHPERSGAAANSRR
jgi:hypothetical protein